MTGIPQRLTVKLKGGGPWGFRLLGGAGTGLPLTVAKIRRKSKSYNNLIEGDLFVSVNGVPCDNLTYDQVMAIADKGGAELKLEIDRKGSKIESASTDVRPGVQLTKTIQQPTSFVNSTSKIEVTKTTVPEEKLFDDSKFLKSTIKSNDVSYSFESEPSHYIKDDESTEKILTSEPASVNITTTENSFKVPEITSDVSTKTSSEDTPTGKKFERVETERIHEKDDNKETTFVRTNYEELVKSSDFTTNPETMPSDTIKESDESQLKSIKLESYEIIKSEKTEVTTTKVNGYQLNTANATGSDDKSSDVEKTALGASVPTLDEKVEYPFSDSEPLSFPDSQFESSVTVKKKKMFSSSSFYEEPHAIYPTVEEQFEMAKKIAESLADDTNKKSKGANMFYKRAKRSTKWIHEGPEPSDSAPETPDTLQEPGYPEVYLDNGIGQKKFPKLKLVLDPRHPFDAASLRSTGHNISEHNVISPEMCHELARDLESPIGKGSALFAKRKKKSAEWVVDEEKVRSLMKTYEQDIDQVKPSQPSAEVKTPSFRLPWDSPFQQPFSRYDSLYNPRVNPERLAETVIQAAENKRRDSVQSLEEHRFERCLSPIVPASPLASYYDIYKPKAPKGWSSKAAISPVPVFPTAPSSQLVEPEEHLAACQSAPSTLPRKFQFQNFNTLPRKWKAHY